MRSRGSDDFWEKVDKTGGPDACWPWTGSMTNGYGRIWVVGRLVRAHRLAWELTHGPIPPETPHVRHVVCRNPACCNPAHLEPGTQTDNMRDRLSDGTVARGERNGLAKLTEPQVREIRQLHAEDGLGCRRLASRFGVGKATVKHILARRTWAWLPQGVAS